jgi:peptide deformylase
MKTLVKPSTKIFNTKLEHFDFNGEHDPKEIAGVLFNQLVTHNGLGLAANQLGLPHRVFIMRGDPCTVCFNPEITYYSEETIVLEEGCLTYPNLFVKVRRPVQIRARWINELGELKTSVLQGLSARVFQHELDHLNGLNYQDRATKFHLEQAKNKQKKLTRKQKKVV